MVSRYSTGLQVAVICQGTQQRANKGRKRKKAGSKMLEKSALQMFYEEETRWKHLLSCLNADTQKQDKL